MFSCVFHYFGISLQILDRHKKTIHSIRSFTATQCAEAIDEAWGHALIGHKKYLGQYIRNQDKISEMYLKSEPYLMVYEKDIVVENTYSEMEILKKQVQVLIKETME